ncbi:unnamed protein product [Auanema sp. JU1783]|nr:unnamed protein product [Auanema sp. JU1783]
MHLFQFIVELQLIYIVPSVILYAAELIYLIRNKDPQFQSAFHTIFFARGPADIVQVMTSLIAFRLPLTGWRFVLQHRWIAKVGFVLSQYACLLELFAQLLLAINRLTAIAYPLTHRWMWSPRSMLFLLLISAFLALLPTAIRFPQKADYQDLGNRVVPMLCNSEDQQLNSVVSCIIYLFFGLTSLILNTTSVCILSKQRKEKLFDQQHRLAIRVQYNLLVYSFSFTLTIIAMTIFQSFLALGILKSDSSAYLIVLFSLTLAADIFALSNPWLLLLLSAPFR